VASPQNRFEDESAYRSFWQLDRCCAPAGTTSQAGQIYDPAFMLPLLDHLLRTPGHIDLHDLIERDALSYVVVALSSAVPGVRIVASRILAQFTVRADEMRYKGSHQVRQKA